MSRPSILVLALLWGVGCQRPFEARLQAGDDAARAGKWGDARAAWGEAVRLDETSGGALARRGLAEWTLGEQATAVESWRAAVKLDPTQPLALEGLALSSLVATDAGAAVDTLAALAPPTGPARLTLARALLGRGNPGDAAAAAAHLQAALVEAPADEHALYLLGSAQIVSRRFGDAQATFERLDRAHPALPLGSYGLARLAAAQGRQTDTLLNLTAAKKIAGAGWNAGPVAADPAFAFLSENADFKTLVGK